MVTRIDNGNETVLVLEGIFNDGNSLEMQEMLNQIVADNRNKIILDISNLQLIDSSNVRMIVNLQKRVRTNGGQIKIVGMRH